MFDVKASGDRMALDISNKARRSWTALTMQLQRKGCFQVNTSLILLDTFVRSHLTFGAAVWGPKYCNRGVECR